MAKIRKGDKIKVMRGKDAGKSGEVVRVIYDKITRTPAQVIVQGINMVKKSQKPNPQFNIVGGILEFEKPLDISNVMLEADSKTTRVGYKVDKSGKKVRVAKKTNKEITK